MARTKKSATKANVDNFDEVFEDEDLKDLENSLDSIDDDEGIKTLDQFIKEFEAKGKNSKIFDQDEFADATSYLDLELEDYEKVDRKSVV